MLYYEVSIDGESCTGCGWCVSVCPVGLLRLQDAKAVVKGSQDECLGCEFCSNACPAGSIKVTVREYQPQGA